jgi:hypothetical protein
LESKTVGEIVIPKAGYKKEVKKIIENFKSKIKREIPRRQEENLSKLASLLINDFKVDKPVVVNLDIGQGKSTLLIEFIKHVYEVNKDFSSVVVKRTLNEGREFCMDVGVNSEDLKEYLDLWCDDDSRREQIEKFYYGDLEEYKEIGFYNGQEKPHEDYFIARLLRGFNYKDCLKWKNPNDKKGYCGSLPSDYVDYSPVLCRNCEHTCGVKLSRWSIEEHPSLVITHQRLFLSNDIKDIIENISERDALIIDEKIETKDIGNILLEDWEKILTKINSFNLKEEIKQCIKDVERYMNQLDFPDRSSDAIKLVRKPYDVEFKFDSSVYGLLADDYRAVKILGEVEKFLNYGGSTSRSWHKNDKKQFSYIRYIDLKEYSKYFKKTIILDATSHIDNDYKKSDVIFLKGLNDTAKGNLNIYHSMQKTTKSSLIYENNSKDENGNRSFKGSKKYYLNNVELIAKDIYKILEDTQKDTLIICYKEIVDKFGNIFSFELDLENTIKTFEKLECKYTIKHFGATTTGVNNYRNYENIIMIGMLNKGQLYYTNKTISIDGANFEDTKINEYLIDSIQQIGRICIRQGKKGNLYLMSNDGGNLIDELKKHFNIKLMDWQLSFYNGINNATESKKKTCWYALVGELKDITENGLMLDYIETRLSNFKKDTVYRNITHPQVSLYMETNNISYIKSKKCFKKKFTKE